MSKIYMDATVTCIKLLHHKTLAPVFSTEWWAVGLPSFSEKSKHGNVQKKNVPVAIHFRS
jgi:hypothetical protein